MATGLKMKCEISELDDNLRQLSVMYGKLRATKNHADDDLRNQIQDHMQAELLISGQQD